jgi:hypothetical protein
MEQSPSWEANRFVASQEIPRRTEVPVQVRGFVCEYFVTKICFRSEELLDPRPTPKLEDHPLSAVRDCLFYILTRSCRP